MNELITRLINRLINEHEPTGPQFCRSNECEDDCTTDPTDFLLLIQIDRTRKTELDC